MVHVDSVTAVMDDAQLLEPVVTFRFDDGAEGSHRQARAIASAGLHFREFEHVPLGNLLPEGHGQVLGMEPGGWVVTHLRSTERVTW